MSRRSSRAPKYCLHKRSGHAYVRINGKQIFLGKYGSDESLEKYRRLVAEWRTDETPVTPLESRLSDITILELISLYFKHAKNYYVKNGEPTGTADRIKVTLKLLKTHYGRTPAAEFGPKRLKALQQIMIEAGNSRSYINDSTRRLCGMFRWAVTEELLPPSVYQALRAVPGLRRGHSEARETLPVQPVDDDTLAKTLEFLSPDIADMVRFQRLTSCRPGEVRTIRPCEVNRSVDPWEYRPGRHKMQHFDRDRVIFIGPQAQAILRPYLLRNENEYCFTSNQLEKIAKRQRKKIAIHYTKDAYYRRIKRACRRAGVPTWGPNRLRHAAATSIRHQYGLEASQVVLGHSRADVTQIYAERDMTLAARIAKEVG